jgi:hypothetical protein
LILRAGARSGLLRILVLRAALLRVLRLVAGALLLVRLVAAAELLGVLHVGRNRGAAAAALVQVDIRAGARGALHADALRRGDLAERNGHHPGKHDRE